MSPRGDPRWGGAQGAPPAPMLPLHSKTTIEAGEESSLGGHAAKQSPHRPGIVRAAGLRTRADSSSIVLADLIIEQESSANVVPTLPVRASIGLYLDRTA